MTTREWTLCTEHGCVAIHGMCPRCYGDRSLLQVVSKDDIERELATERQCRLANEAELHRADEKLGALRRDLAAMTIERDDARALLANQPKPMHDAPLRRLLESEIEKLRVLCESRRYLYWWDMGSMIVTLAAEKLENQRERGEWSKAMRLLVDNGTYATTEIVPAIELVLAQARDGERLRAERDQLLRIVHGPLDTAEDLGASHETAKRMREERDHYRDAARASSRVLHAMRDAIETSIIDLRKMCAETKGPHTSAAGIQWSTYAFVVEKTLALLRRILAAADGDGETTAALDASDAAKGLYGKYRIEKVVDPTGKHRGCDFFVLDLTHDKDAVIALEAYAEACWRDKPTLYDDLNDKLAAITHRQCIGARKHHGSPGPRIECHAPAVVPLGNGVWFCVKHAPEYAEGAGPQMTAALARRLAVASEGKR